MKFLKKWAIIVSIYLGSLIALVMIASQVGDYFGFNVSMWIVNTYVGILAIWIVYQVFRAIFKASVRSNRSYYVFLAKFYFQKNILRLILKILVQSVYTQCATLDQSLKT